MVGYILKRLLLAVPTLFAVLSIVFVLARVLPGDPAQTILGDQASQEALASMRHRLGVDKPIGAQYVDFLVNAVRGEWGNSLVTGKPVVEEVRNVLPYTIDLTVTAIVLGALIGIPLGVWSAMHRNTWVDYLVRIGSLLGLSFPAFVLAILLLLAFAIQLRWFPVISAGRLDDPVERLRSLALPAVTLGVIMAAYVTRDTRRDLAPHFPQRTHSRGHRRRSLSRHPDRQFGVDRDRVQPTGARQADGQRAQPARLHSAARHDGRLRVRHRPREPADRSHVRIHRPAGETPMSAQGRPKRELLPLGGKARSAKGVHI